MPRKLVRGDDIFAVADAVPCGRDRADLPGDADRRRIAVSRSVPWPFVVVKIERRNGRSQNVHRVGFLRKRTSSVRDHLGGAS